MPRPRTRQATNLEDPAQARPGWWDQPTPAAGKLRNPTAAEFTAMRDESKRLADLERETNVSAYYKARAQEAAIYVPDPRFGAPRTSPRKRHA